MVNTQQSATIFTKLTSLKLRTKFSILMGFMLTSFVIAATIGNMSFNKVLVNGPVYEHIANNKDLVADILPPPAYLLESWQVALEMVSVKNQPLQPLIDKSTQLAKDFKDRSVYWDKAITDPKMHEIIQAQLLPSGNEFLRVRDNLLIPAVESHDQKSIDSALSELKNAYDKHRLAVDALATLAISNSKVIESSTNAEIVSSKITILSLILVALGLTITGIYFVVSRVISQLGAEPDDMHTLASRIAMGNLSSSIVLKTGDQNSVMYAMQSMQDKIKLLITDSETLSQAALAGRLTTRVDANQHQGDFRKVVEGVNATLDAVIDPLNVAAKYVAEIAKGNVPEKITETYHGDFNTVKINLNQCIDAINALIEDSAMLANAARNGLLSTRANADRHHGDFHKIVDGVNETLDALIGPLNDAAHCVQLISKGEIPAKITETYHGDFNVIKNNLNQCIDAINALIEDATMLAEAARKGLLSTRADAERHQGDFHKIVDGVNDTLDAVIGPLNDAASCVESISKGDIPAKITTPYHGDFNTIKDNLNTCIDAVNLLVADANILSQAAAEGRITTRADATLHQGDFRKVVEGVNATLETIVAPIIAVKEAIETINSATHEISLGNNDLSARTEQQAASLEETAASMEELASTVKQNSENAKEANQLAQTASEAAIKGGEVVANVVNTMNGINESAHHIENIISVIDGIAFQTNILALNAAVEAARAGEQGRGFAVVAGEVRSLAQRSASAAKEIKELITNSVTKTAEGAQLVSNAGKTMDEVVISVQHVADIINQIAASSFEQSNGIEQVNVAVVSMDETTQRNAALVEEAAAASESLVEQADALSNAISVFKLGSKAEMNHSSSKLANNVTKLPQSESNFRLNLAKASSFYSS